MRFPSFLVKSPGTENPENEEGKGNIDEPEDSNRETFHGPWAAPYRVSHSQQ